MLSSTYNRASVSTNDEDRGGGGGSNSNNAAETHNTLTEETTISFTPLRQQEQQQRYLSRIPLNDNNNNTDTTTPNISQEYEADDENSSVTTTTPLLLSPLPPTNTNSSDLPPHIPNHRATYTDRNGLLLYLDPNVRTPTIRFRLSEERHSQNRCMSNLYFVVIYLLMRLWLEAFLTKSPSFVAVCAVGTLWIGYGLYRRRRDWDEELERRMEELMMLVSGGGGEVVALFGGEGSEGDGGVRGVSEEMRRKWVRFVYGEDDEGEQQRLLGPMKVYGSVDRGGVEEVTTTSSLMVRGGGGAGDAEGEGRATCSICLCDYEDGERVVILPCSHMYHDDCITPWTLNHTKCPLCNFDLQLNER